MRTLAILLISAVGAFAQTYSVSVLHGPSGWTNVGFGAINDSGQVAGAGVNVGTQPLIGTTSGSTAVCSARLAG